MQKHLRLFIFITTILFMTSFAELADADELVPPAPVTPVSAKVPTLSGPQMEWVLSAYSSLYLAEELDTQWNGTPSTLASPESTVSDAKLFNDSIDHFYQEMQDPAFDDETVKGFIASMKESGRAYVRQKGAAYALVFVLSEAGDLAILGFSLLTGNVAMFTLFSVVPFQTSFVAAYVGISSILQINKTSKPFGSIREHIRFMLAESRAKRALDVKNSDLLIPLASLPGVTAKVSSNAIIQKILVMTHLKKRTITQRSLTRFIKANGWWDDEMDSVLDQNTSKQLRAVELLQLLQKKNPEGLEEALKDEFPKAILETQKIRNPELLGWGLDLVQTVPDDSEGLAKLYQIIDSIPANTSPTVFAEYWKHSIIPYLATQRNLIAFKPFRKLIQCFNNLEGAFFSGHHASWEKSELDLFKNYVHSAIDQQECVSP